MNDNVFNKTERLRSRGQQMLKNEVAKGCNPYVPFDFGNLSKSVEPSIGTDEPFLVYTVPYAARQYYGFPNKSKDVHPNATKQWFEVWKAADGQSVIKKVKEGVEQWFKT
ncbi:MAG: minor capsid protein [Oscillospiraceae bacterium]|nr:minor capsid protein [Oscillospiraceae bacterium]